MKKAFLQTRDERVGLFSAINSFLGVLGHYKSYNIKAQLFLLTPYFTRYGFFTPWLRKYKLS